MWLRPERAAARGTLAAMRVRRLPVGLVVPALLVALVALLATLQYQWLGKVSEAEREQLRRSLDQRAREFAEEFDAEIARIYLSHHLAAADVAAGEWRGFAAALDQWRTAARFPRMVRGVYLAETAGDRRTLRRYDDTARSFGPPSEAWPAHLQKILARLGGARAVGASPERRPQVVAITITPVLPDVPALLIPVSAAPSPDSALRGLRDAVPPAAGLSSNTRFWLGWPGAYVIVDLDDAFLRDTVLPALAARHFPGEGGGAYRVAVLSPTGATLFARGAQPGERDDAQQGDVVVSFFNLRLDVVRDLLPTVTFRSRMATDEPGGAAGEGQRVAVVVEHRSDTGMAGMQLTARRPGWRLVLRHPAGSLDAAVSQARRRNLWLGFGILAVLVAGVGLVVVNARRAGQLAARQMDFVATVSHELRTPLTVIRSAAQNLSAGVVSNPGQARRYGELIEDEGRRLTDMVEQILEYARFHGERPLRTQQLTDVRVLVEDVLSSCRPLCEQAGMTLEVTCEPADLPLVQGDVPALRRALHNLVANALKHAADGRWIGVAVGADGARGHGQVFVAVSDRGPGIPAPDLAHLFEPFYRGRRAVERQVHGNGLGLSLVRRIAEAHGGSVTVKSAVGEETTFVLRLPAAVPSGEDQAVPNQADRAGASR